MSVDVREISLHDAVKFIVDNRGKTVPTADNGIPLIATNCIKNNGLFPVFEKIRFVSEETYKTWFRSHPEPGDIIFVNKGTPGRVCLVPNPVNFCIAQDMVALRVDESVIYPKYLFAALRSDYIQNVIENMHVGTLIPHFKKSDFERLMIPVPDEVTQKYIGNLYYDLSMAIELNNQINKNLEEMAQAIFKSWFVDFEPFRDGEFEESELGLIPKGWRVGKLSDVGEIIGGGTPSKSKPEYYSEIGIPWITPKDLSINKNKYISRGEIDISELGLRESSARLMPKGTVLFSSRAPIGYIAIAKNAVTTNQGFKSVVPFENISSEYIYLLLKNSINEIESRATGSTFKEISGGEMKKVPIILPPKEIIRKFNEIATTLGKTQASLEDENSILMSIRDTLLPKLMTGEIRVPVEEVV
ncbi:restriction endonuclease subunit S [Acetivibrio straminisolvens]|uniref:restriction endonuclease subunit S n=1 Tax=Acetivibrio straminisolvens TaxID=253314 RepID=UPI002240714C|nr:restriction endonuclease subunit S [Acetivibrio straminisolvens]